MPQLRRLDSSGLGVEEGLRALQLALQTNRTLQELSLWSCDIDDEGIRILVDALVGNTTMDKLCVHLNRITSNGLPDITRLLESTRLQTINFGRGS